MSTRLCYGHAEGRCDRTRRGGSMRLTCACGKPIATGKQRLARFAKLERRIRELEEELEVLQRRARRRRRFVHDVRQGKKTKIFRDTKGRCYRASRDYVRTSTGADWRWKRRR